MDLMKQCLLKVENEKLMMNHREDMTVRVILAEDIENDRRSEDLLMLAEKLPTEIRRSLQELW